MPAPMLHRVARCAILAAMNQKTEKTNAMRALDQRRIPYTAHTFSPEIHSADGVAAGLGVPAATVYKTLVVPRPHGHPLLVLIAGERELDLRLLARSLGEKSLEMATHKEAESLTGLQVGGISALALLGRGFDVCIDLPAISLDQIFVSAGQRGINLRLAVSDLVQVTGARALEATSAPAV
jgi:Cys-tRNA(Pro)/Cys-tRNA(Cys) deacylase